MAHRVLLDGGPEGWSVSASDPLERVVFRAGCTWHWHGRWRRRDVDPLELLRERLAALGAAEGVGFRRGAIGVLGYGLRHAFERLPSARLADPFPDLWFGLYERVTPFELPVAEVRAGRLRRETTAAEHGRAVGRALAHIAAGDVYQVNLTQRFSCPLYCDAWSLFCRLRALNPAPFAAYLELEGDQRVVSSSPERFVRLRGTEASARPIKGTRPRGPTPEADAALAAELLGSEKDAAELAMIVDLLRNDLGRVARWGSVRVAEDRRLESHPSVHHLVATVVAELAEGRDWADLVRAAFPGGSITGAPKIRAMELIADLEPAERGVYTGSVGYVDASGEMDLSIAIRTIAVAGGRAWFWAGGGIVADSDPAAEYRECLDKARPMAAALGASL